MGETENNLLKIYMGKIISYGGEYYEKLSRRKKQRRIGSVLLWVDRWVPLSR